MKAVLISIQPKWCELIYRGKKTVEVRKTKPKLETPFRCFIYCTKSNGTLFKRNGNKFLGYSLQDVSGMVIGEFVCNRITYLGNISTDKWEYLSGSTHEYHKQLVTNNACLTENEMLEYGGKYGWHITDLVIYDEPRELSEFYTIKKCSSCKSGYESTACIYDEDCKVPVDITRPPQSWCYVEEATNEMQK